MKWNVEVRVYGGPPESAEVEAETVGEAVTGGLEDLGFDGNDEGSYQITVEATE